jgi:hypothetical protein
MSNIQKNAHPNPQSNSGSILLIAVAMITIALALGIYWVLMNEPVGSHGKRPQTVKVPTQQVPKP